MKISIKSQLLTGLGVVSLVLSPMAVAHGLDGHHAPFMTLMHHLFTEHGYLLVPIALAMLWFARRDKGLRNVLASLRRRLF